MRRERFAPNGLLALAPRAFGATFDVYAPSAVAETSGPCVVSVRGPLMNHAEWCFDSYEAIKARVAMALASSASCVVLDVDSPGGLVSGCFDTARELRKMADAAGKPILAFAVNATSAAYALVCCADRIYTSETGRLGSIGVIETIVDATAQDAALGLKFELITSGARKTDGNPHSAISASALAATQATVDTAALLFYDYVAERRGISAESVRAQEAGVFLGAEAVSLRLADSLSTLDGLLAIVADPLFLSSLTESKSNMAAGTVSAAIEALTKAAESDDKDERANARRMLAKYYAEDAQAEDKSDGDDEKKDKEGAAGASDDKKEESVKDDEKKDDDSKAKAAAVDSGLLALAEVHKMKAERAAEKLEIERKDLLASRPDFAPEMLAALGKAEIETVRAFVKDLPKGKIPTKSTVRDAQAALASAPPSHGDGTDTAPREGYTLEDLDRQMGLGAPKLEASWRGEHFQLPTVTTVQAREMIAKQKATVAK